MTEWQIFGANLRCLRKEHALSQRQMADSLEISVYSLRKIDRGILPPRVKVSVVLLFCKQFHLKPTQAFSPLWK